MSRWFIFSFMTYVLLLLALGAIAPVPRGFYNPATLDFNESTKPGQFMTLTADGHFEDGRVVRSGTGSCAVVRYEYHTGTFEVHDSTLVLTATSGRVRNVAPCDLAADYEKNEAGVRTVTWHADSASLALAR